MRWLFSLLYLLVFGALFLFVIMSDSEPELEEVVPGSRRSSRLASRRGSDGSASAAGLRARGVNPAPGLEFSQLQDLAAEADGVSSDQAQSPPVSGVVFSSGRKRARKTLHRALLDPAAGASAGPAVAPPSAPASTPPGDALSSTLLVLASSLQSIEARLRSLESAGASTSAAAGMFPPVGAPPPAPAPLVAIDEPHYTLASAVAAPFSGRPYVPASADISPRLRSHILQGRNINLIRLILPSPECDVSITAGSQICAVIKTADPRLARDMSIGEFVVAFGIFREVLCSVFPQRRTELDGYLALIGDLNLRYGQNVFYLYHKGFCLLYTSPSPRDS